MTVIEVHILKYSDSEVRIELDEEGNAQIFFDGDNVSFDGEFDTVIQFWNKHALGQD